VVRDQAKRLARELNVVGLMNVQFALMGRSVYILEVNPRASRTIPFVSKATGVPLAKIAARAMLGESLVDIGLTTEPVGRHVAVKEVVFPFSRFPGNDTLLGPEMKSTGEVMGIDTNFGRAFWKAQVACGFTLPNEGSVFISVREADKPLVLSSAKSLIELGFTLVCTQGTRDYLKERGVESTLVHKVNEGRPHVVDVIISGEIHMVINTTVGRQAILDSRSIRRSAFLHNIPYQTTIPGAWAVVQAIKASRENPKPHICSLQELYASEA
jgi:carbamoyl-phosphate synthase large subunit